jgi:hypothetical protein
MLIRTRWLRHKARVGARASEDSTGADPFFPEIMLHAASDAGRWPRRASGRCTRELANPIVTRLRTVSSVASLREMALPYHRNDLPLQK